MDSDKYINKIAIYKNEDKRYMLAILDKGENAPDQYRYEAIAYSFASKSFISIGGSKTKLFRNHKYREATPKEKKEAITKLLEDIFGLEGLSQREREKTLYNISMFLRLRGVKDWRVK